MSWALIETDAALANALAHMKDATEIAVDTEFMRRNSYFPRVALLQLCADDHAYLIDPLLIGDLAPLRELMTDSTTLKILHSCSEDLEVFRHWLGLIPTPIVDTQRAAALLGEDFGLGYRALVLRFLDIELEKGETRSDWLRRPLSESQCHYAAQDVLHLLPVWRLLRDRAETAGRMDWVLEEGAEAARALAEREKDGYRRVKSASRLHRDQLAVLRAIYEWREERARLDDKPRGWILDDKACIALARAMPSELKQLLELQDLPHAIRRKHGETLFARIDAVHDLSEEELPDAMPGTLDPTQRAQLKKLRERAREAAEKLRLAPEILLTGADLELLLREAAGQGIDVPQRWSGWRDNAIVSPLRSLLAEASQ